MRPRVLVTGGCGFIGSALVRALVETGSTVTVLDNLSRGKLENLEDIPQVNILPADRADVTIDEHVEAALEGQHSVVHLAALPWVHDSWLRHREYADQNVLGTETICRLARSSNIQRLVFASTAEVYGDSALLPNSEDAPTDAASPYGRSKIEAENMVRAHARNGLRAVTLRLFNAYGPRAGWPFVIPEIVRQALKDDEIVLGDTSRRRDFVFVDDTARAIVAALARPGLEGEAINVGGGRSYAISNIVARVAAMVGREAVIRQDHERLRPEDPFEFRADLEKARALLAWVPTTDLDTGLARTIGWYVEHGMRWQYEPEPATLTSERLGG